MRGRIRRLASAAASAGLAMSMACGVTGPLTWDDVRSRIRERFPGVRGVTTSELAEWLRGGASVHLLDARAAEEYAVSHLQGAHHAPHLSAALEVLADVSRDATIVAYCSVGVRSARLAEALGERGFENVRNLDGSIFGWANEGRPVVRDGRAVREVHPFDERWGTLLDPGLRAYSPTSPVDEPGDAPR